MCKLVKEQGKTRGAQGYAMGTPCKAALKKHAERALAEKVAWIKKKREAAEKKAEEREKAEAGEAPPPKPAGPVEDECYMGKSTPCETGCVAIEFMSVDRLGFKTPAQIQCVPQDWNKNDRNVCLGRAKVHCHGV